ncbi:MAG TPA: SAM-dependent chlorinase/fluorinase [Dehalococcoidia bacterium]|nr:SAM-dependent chlorinase/fluorinase [Dehalococcoidia bacterium]
MSTVITLTTDFGLDDAYVAAIKGVILGINPEARLVDICHTIRPQAISQAAFILSTAYPFFPTETVHLVVVDPGVGSERKAIIMRTPSAYFVAPDNGVLSYVVDDCSSNKDQIETISVTNSRYWRSPVSATFHGRDIFAPVAAYLSLGYQPNDFGEGIASVKTLQIAKPLRNPDDSITGTIRHIDSFGNLITNIRHRDLPSGPDNMVTEISGRKITGLAHTYADGEGLMALIGSSGYLEISVKDGSARDLLGAEVGDELILRTIAGDRR